MRYSSIELHVYLSSNLVSRPVVLGIKSLLTFEGIHLAGNKVADNLLLTNKPCCDQAPDHIKQTPGLYPSRAIEVDIHADIGLSTTF